MIAMNMMFSYIINHSQVCSILTIMILIRITYMILTYLVTRLMRTEIRIMNLVAKETL